MLLEKMKEIEAFNASRVSAKARNQGEGSANTQKEKRARCYICKIHGHVFWKCPNKKKKNMNGKQKEKVRPEIKKVAENVKYPEKVHVITDYIIEGTDEGTWNETWYVSSTYKFHMCPTRELFRKLKYKFEMIEKEEIEKKFIFSYGVGDIIMEARKGNFVIPNVHYTPEVTLNVLSIDQLEEQGYIVKIGNNKCNLHYMFDEARTGKAQGESVTEDGLKDVVNEHNKFLDKYFESIEPKDEGSLVKGLEELEWDRKDVHDYVDEEYISWNGSLYSLKVNSFSRFLSFMNLIKEDSIVYKHWEIFSKKYVEMLKWFYLVYLNYDILEKIPPFVGVMEINLLSLHKIVDSLGGYLCITLGDKWKTVASIQGLTDDNDGEAIKGVLVAALYVDDLIFTGNNKLMIDQFKESMTREFEMTDLGLMKYFLGSEVRQEICGIFISQTAYAKEILKKSKMENSNPVVTPMNWGTNKEQEVRLNHVMSRDQTADIFTKALPAELFNLCKQKMGMKDARDLSLRKEFPEVSHRPFMGEVVQALKLVCNECEETRDLGSRTCSQEDLTSLDFDPRVSTNSGHGPDPGPSHSTYPSYESPLDVESGFSGLGLDVHSYRITSSSGPLRPRRRLQIWEKMKRFSSGNMSDYGDFLKLLSRSR
ncbi:ARID DNA-binding domain-containing protein [Tanacetum coccineum]